MGCRYVTFRICYELSRKTGLIRLRFPKKSNSRTLITLESWRNLKTQFFFDLDHIGFTADFRSVDLKMRYRNISQNRFQYFQDQWYYVPDWHTNPVTGYEYNPQLHWSLIADLSDKQGDIKYVWEKSRFTFLYDLIRYDCHFKEDQSQFVFSAIEDWIDKNPVNCGPNWLCGQEISLRVMNWTFALYYYRLSENLNQRFLDKITVSIHDQITHVASNIFFSLIAVRNNHALTESLALYLTGLLFPFLPKSTDWKRKGRRWFEQEIAYQIGEDGTFLQHSMNYHRVAVQLLSWAIGLAEKNDETWSEILYKQARNSLRFLIACQDLKTGWLPNYGANDGALFFPLTSAHFRDFRPQLSALGTLLGIKPGYENGIWEEEKQWLVGRRQIASGTITPDAISSFDHGGYFIVRDAKTITFLRCGSYRNRPFQADNLHLDIWVDGENILMDAGSYLYNTCRADMQYFAGTASHNTVMLGDFDQMKAYTRFIWGDWITKSAGEISMETDGFSIKGEFEGFIHIGKKIAHKRRVHKQKGQLQWKVEDWITNAPEKLPMRQLWHPSETFFNQYQIAAWDESGKELSAIETARWYSETYGKKVALKSLEFSTTGRYIKTTISVR